MQKKTGKRETRWHVLNSTRPAAEHGTRPLDPLRRPIAQLLLDAVIPGLETQNIPPKKLQGSVALRSKQYVPELGVRPDRKRIDGEWVPRRYP